MSRSKGFFLSSRPQRAAFSVARVCASAARAVEGPWQLLSAHPIDETHRKSENSVIPTEAGQLFLALAF